MSWGIGPEKGCLLPNVWLAPEDREQLLQNPVYNRSRRQTMAARFVLSDYVDQAMALASYDKLADGTFGGRVPGCTGVVAFGATLRECETELRSTLEDWILVGLKLG
jgi:uncharacterized protein UPF0150